MTNYTDYDYYKNIYKGNMPETDFNRLVIRASAEVRKNIFDRDVTGYKDDVQMATCSVADLLLKIEQIEQRKDSLTSSNSNVVSSESVGDLSRTFANTTNLSELENEIFNQKAKIIEEIRMYLLHTGLLYRGA